MNTKLEEYLWEVRMRLINKHGYTFDQSGDVIYPLSWYVNTGRSSAEFDKRLLTVKPYIIARILAKGYVGQTHDAIVESLKNRVMRDEN